MQEMEWLVEHETLPPDDPSPGMPDGPKSSDQKVPSWLWPSLMIGTAFAICLALLWRLGGQADPVPPPDRQMERLQATINTEINAILEGDPEIYDQTQDKITRRSQFHPPAGEFNAPAPPQVQEIELTGNYTAQAVVELGWQNESYQMHWYYRLVNLPPHGARWVHTDWNQTNLGELIEVKRSQIKVYHYPADKQPAEQLADALQSFLHALCSTVDCWVYSPVSITLDPSLDTYGLIQDRPTEWRIPSPMRVRWPADGDPDPLVLSSLARQLSFTIQSQSDRQRYRLLEPRSQAAFTLTSFWLAHHLLDMEPLPTTQWLDQALAPDEVPSLLAFQQDLLRGIPPQEALATVLDPDVIHALPTPDFFAWLLTVTRPDQISYPNSDLREEHRSVSDRFDWGIDPWADNQSPYHLVVPAFSSLFTFDFGVVAHNQPGQWLSSYAFIRYPNGLWQLNDHDALPAGQQQITATDHFTLTFWAGNDSLIKNIQATLDIVVPIVKANFQPDRQQKPHFVLLPNAWQNNVNLWLDSEMAVLYSPVTFDDGVYDLSFVQFNITKQIITYFFQPAASYPNSNWHPLREGLVRWQIDQLNATSPGLFDQPLGRYNYEYYWRPPASLSSEEWLPLVNLWHYPSVQTIKEEQNLETSAWLVAHYVVDIYGPNNLPKMLNALNTADSMEAWTAMVAGRSLVEFELDWRQWVIKRYQE